MSIIQHLLALMGIETSPPGLAATLSPMRQFTYQEVEKYFDKLGGVHAAGFDEVTSEVRMGYTPAVISRENLTKEIQRFADLHGYSVSGHRDL